MGLKRILRDLVGLRPIRLQVAALCLRGSGDARQVLLVTSRDTGRWLLPKGWPMRGKGLAASALEEAWEEAGVRGTVQPRSVGRYHDIKRAPGGAMDEPVRVLVFRVDDVRMHSEFPEAGQRERQWVSPAEAARMVEEGSLADLLRRV
ncbi:MAG: NUDIX hydrolase [Pseudoxanthomonas suwonensis]|nr:NUDIX hydrolase [Pseudoxanthomonas suwonensis]